MNTNMTRCPSCHVLIGYSHAKGCPLSVKPPPVERWTPPALVADPPPAKFATDEQIALAVNMYAAEMIARGVHIGPEHIETLCRAARIQDIWRVAFARAVK
jgi:hypothetical protein